MQAEEQRQKGHKRTGLSESTHVIRSAVRCGSRHASADTGRVAKCDEGTAHDDFGPDS